MSGSDEPGGQMTDGCVLLRASWVALIPCSRMEGALELPRQYLHAIFYEHYHKAIQGYNARRKPVRNFLKGLGAMLISVSLTCCSDTRVLTWTTGTISPCSDP